jgi:hypothetical protein
MFEIGLDVRRALFYRFLICMRSTLSTLERVDFDEGVVLLK